MRALALILIAGTATADGMSSTPSQGFGYEVDCFCTDKFRNRHELGSVICIELDGRSFMAECQMSQNVPMWRERMQGCPGAMLRTEPALRDRITALMRG